MVGGSAPVLAAAPFKWATLLGAQPTVPHFLEEFALEVAAAPTAGAAAAVSDATGGRFAGLSGEVRRQQLMSEVSGVITNLLGTGEVGVCGVKGLGRLVFVGIREGQMQLVGPIY
jgi:hypothetical protein